VTSRDFDQVVERAVRRIPRRFRRRLDSVAFMVEPEGPDPNLLGIYHGRPLPARSVSDAFHLPDRIVIYQKPHERLARDLAHLEKLVEDTVWHEVAHYFGMDEAQVGWSSECRWRRRKTAGGAGNCYQTICTVPCSPVAVACFALRGQARLINLRSSLRPNC
jgi:predicted Zn-dependent protease with MMP-like domain